MRIRNILLGLIVTLAFAPCAVPRPKVVTSPKYSQAQVKEGKALFKSLNCASCHSVDEKGGCLAPSLNGVTQRRSADYLLLRLSSAKGDEDRFIANIGHSELVPHPRFPRAQVKALIAYLSTFKK